jgi:hypothetical protein
VVYDIPIEVIAREVSKASRIAPGATVFVNKGA